MARSSRPTDDVGQLSEQFTRAFRRMRRGVAAQMAPLGITFSQARVLRMIARSGSPLRVGDIAARLEIAPRSATGMVDTLEEAGLVERRPDPDDRRSVLVALSKKGAGLVEAMAQARHAGASELFGRLTPQQRADLLALLEALNADPDLGGGSSEDGPAAETPPSAAEVN
jgi:DNA-binding MarR family transcriptional regulator